nr:hypothetical protein [Tanacetum cinerariifolium]
PVLSPAPPPSPIRSLGYRAAMIRLRDKDASTSHSPLLQLPSASRREDRLDVTLPPRKRLDIALGPRYEVGESSSAAATRPAEEARMSRKAWVRATDASDLVHGEVMSLRTTVLGQMSKIKELQVTALQAQVTTLQGQQGLAGDPTQLELPEEAG